VKDLREERARSSAFQSYTYTHIRTFHDDDRLRFSLLQQFLHFVIAEQDLLAALDLLYTCKKKAYKEEKEVSEG
jgi:hypothetical protein